MNHYDRHLSAEARAAIMMIKATHSIRAIAHYLDCAPSAVSLEIARHSINGYDASLAGYLARLTRHRPRRRRKLLPYGESWSIYCASTGHRNR